VLKKEIVDEEVVSVDVLNSILSPEALGTITWVVVLDILDV
jgi:hypothetical protein